MRPATVADVLHVHKTMWSRGREELAALGISSGAWFEGWIQRIQRGDAVSFGSHAILGWDPEGPGVCTSFQASKTFEAPGVGRQVTKEMRSAIPKLMEGRGVPVAFVYSLCVDPEAPKWFRLLGFNEDPTFKGCQRGPYTMRRFIRRT